MVLPALCHLFRVMEVSDDDPGYVLRFKAAFTSDVSKSEREEVWKLIKEENAQQPEPHRETEPDPPKKKMNLLFAASDSDEEGDPASDMSVDRYRDQLGCVHAYGIKFSKDILFIY
ncbi:E3 SUMO-protein ligase ZBED1-like [Scomber scombrus]|uniref:E3 SUMO-protein ligase ZBED1-like n=1 Tax=Scomber scombrus TaxID=13677 RepID=A0AAV1Q2M8_SCOSC